MVTSAFSAGLCSRPRSRQAARTCYFTPASSAAYPRRRATGPFSTHGVEDLLLDRARWWDDRMRAPSPQTARDRLVRTRAGGIGVASCCGPGVLGDVLFGVVDIFGYELLVALFGGADQLEHTVDILDLWCPSRER